MADDKDAPQPLAAPIAPPVDQLSQGGQPTIQPATANVPAPPQATIAPRTPSPIERVTRALSEGVPAFNDKFEAASHTNSGTLANGETPKMQMITPEAGMTAKEKKDHPIATGLAETAGALSDPTSTALIAGTGGFGELPGAAGKLFGKLVSLHFSARAIKGAYDAIPEFKKAMDAGDASEAERIFTHIVVDTAMGASAAQHGGIGEAKAAIEGAGVPDEASTLNAKSANADVPESQQAATQPSTAGDGTEVPAHVSFDKFGGKELRGPTSFGRTGGPFGKSVDAAFDVARQYQPQEPGVSAKADVSASGPEWDRVHTAVVDGKNVGSVGYKLDTDGRAQIYGSNVSPDLRGKGVGQKLYMAAIDDARDAGASKITSDSTNTSADANRVWEKLRDKGLPVENIVHPNGKPGYQIDFDNPSEAAPAANLPPAEHEATLARRGQLPGQKVNLNDAYGDSGRYVGGLIEARGKGDLSPTDQYVQNTGKTSGPALLDIPEHIMPEGSTTHDIMTHELAHAVVGNLMGLPMEDTQVISHLHPEADGKQAAAVTGIDYSKIPGVRTSVSKPGMFNFSDEALAQTWPKFLDTFVAGGVAQELGHGIKFETNEGLSGDLGQLHRMGKTMGFTEPEVNDMIDAARERATKILSHPETMDIIKNAAATREEGLSRTLHASNGKIQDVIRQVKEARANEGNNEGVGGTDGGVTGAAGTAGAGQGAEAAVRSGNGQTVSPDLAASKVKPVEPEEKPWSEKAVDMAKNQGGGFTIDPRTGEAPKKGYQVEVGMNQSAPVEGDSATAADVQKFYEDNKELFDKHPELQVGGYKNNLAISANAETLDAAKRVAKKLNQVSIWDNAKGVEIPTGGDGTATNFPNYSLDERMNELRGKPASDVPGLEHVSADVARQLQPDEKGYLLGNKTLQKNVMSQYHKIAPSVNETTNAMQAGAALGGWWQRYINIFHDLAGGGEAEANTIGPSHAEVLKQWHAAVSGNKSVEDANNLAWHSYADWLDAGKPTDRASINEIVKKNAAQPEGSTKKGNAAISDTLNSKGKVISKGLDTNKLFGLVNSPEMRGERPFSGDAFNEETPNPLVAVTEGARKIPSMGATVAGKGNLNRVVIDAHIRDFYGHKNSSGPAAQYIADSVHLRQAAEALGLKGGEGQEQLWGTVLGLKTLLKQGLTPAEASGKLDAGVINSIGKDYAEVMANDPEITKPGGILDRLKDKYGIGWGSDGFSAANSEAPSAGNPSEGGSGSGEKTIDQPQLAQTAQRILGQISESKIKKPATATAEPEEDDSFNFGHNAVESAPAKPAAKKSESIHRAGIFLLA